MALVQDTGQSGFDTAVAELLKEVRTLMRQELVLARHEVQYEIGKLLRAVLWFVISMVLAGIGLSVIAAACVLILFEYTGLPAWTCAVNRHAPTQTCTDAVGPVSASVVTVT